MAGASPADAGDPGCSPASLAAIDASCRKPILLLFGAGVVWLMIGTVLALLASWKLHEPALLTDHAWLTFGRIRPAHTHAVVYGFAFQAAMGVTLWLVSRLGRTPLWHPGIATCGALFWNLGMVIAQQPTGGSTGIEWLEFPRLSPILFASYARWDCQRALGSAPEEVVHFTVVSACRRVLVSMALLDGKYPVSSSRCAAREQR